MSNSFLDKLIGPFGITQSPVMVGWYVVNYLTTDNQGRPTKVAEMWHWNGTEWTDSDDGLGITCDTSLSGIQWFGQSQPGLIEAPQETDVFDGLDGDL